jgi:glycosyltransferase involved in cell wall biosynthesis
MSKVLAFCFFPAFVPPSNGGQSRLFNFYRALSQWHEITLLTSTHHGVQEERILHGTGFVERRIPKDNFFIEQYSRLNPFTSGGDISGPALAACSDSPTLLHQAYLKEYESADLIIHDSPFTSKYDIFAGIDNKPRIYNAYNCESLLYEQLHPEEHSKPIHDIVQTSEVHILGYSDFVLFCNEDDLFEFRKMAPQAHFKSIYAPNGMQPLVKNSRAGERKKNRFTTVFMGSGHPPNSHAANFITNELALALPEIDFHFIGSCLPQGSYPSNVYRHGLVSDNIKHELLATADLALNPMAAGSGSNVKVLDYFAHALPVLSTSFGMRGIQAEANKDYLEAEIEQFSKVLKAVTSRPDFLNELAENGKALALERYTWKAIAAKVSEDLETIFFENTKRFSRYVLVLNDYDSFAGIGGGSTRTLGLYRAVSQWCPVIFVAFSDHGTLKARRHTRDITVINIPKTREHLDELQAVNNKHHVSVDDIIAGQHCVNNPYFSAIYQSLRDNARCIIVEHCYLVGLPHFWGDRFVYSSQNHESVLKARLLQSHPLKESLIQKVERFERVAVESSAVTIAVSTEDAESLVKGKRSAGPVIVVRNGAAVPASGDTVDQAKVRLAHQIGERAVVFLGSAHMPNVEAAHFIAEKLALQCTRVRFHILGSVCQVLAKVPSNVVLWGVVDDETKSALMQSCLLAINPMRSGSGSNVKLADYVGNGLFVVTTEFGQRGYPSSVQEHLHVVSLDDFAAALELNLNLAEQHSVQMRKARQELFLRELSMQSLASRFVEALQGLESPKKRVLYVTYRYVSPPLGGAEVNLERFISALGHCGQFDVDVVAPEVSTLQSHWRFGEHYDFDSELSAPVDIPNVRFARFPMNQADEVEMLSGLRRAWQVQPNFERAVSERLQTHYNESGLTWGWGYPEGEPNAVKRWAYIECGIHLHTAGHVEIEAYAPFEAVITVSSDGAQIGGPTHLIDRAKFEFDAPAGHIVMMTSTQAQPADPRPLGFHVHRLLINGQAIDLAAPLLPQHLIAGETSPTAFRILGEAAHATRSHAGVSLCETRGPWSSGLERFIKDHIAEYDLVIANNNIFRPAVYAMAEAKRQGVPSILIPHAHLDDDFYHFPDWLQSARDASLVLAVPKAACDYLRDQGCHAEYLPAGCDTQETFSEEDAAAFKRIYPDERPFVLVLGRKAGAKGYQKVVEAVDQLNLQDIAIRVVLIGPDDDGQPVTSPHSTYLGRQPREIVRGALKSCLALCNMSSSESFGIVLLEAWLAGKPVIANKNCAAFHDMAIHLENALLVDSKEIGSSINALLTKPELGSYLGKNGRRQTEVFDWKLVSSNFVDTCILMCKK